MPTLWSLARDSQQGRRRCEGCLVVRSGHGPQAEVAQGLDLDLSLNSEVNIRKGWKENSGTK